MERLESFSTANVWAAKVWATLKGSHLTDLERETAVRRRPSPRARRRRPPARPEALTVLAGKRREIRAELSTLEQERERLLLA